MNFPFTTEQFLNVFKSYNLSVWPAQVFLVVLAILTIFLAVYKTKFSSQFVSISLMLYWLWIGVVYHFVFFTHINKAAFVFAALFVTQGAIFLYFGIVKNDLHFSYRNNLKGIIAIIFFLYALIFYPLIGYSLGHYYPVAPTFGLPCPTTIFTLGIMLLLEGKVKKILFVIPLLWAVIGFTAAIKLGILQDIGLLASAILTVIVLFFDTKIGTVR
jgi:hypothetical protein